MIKLKRVYEPYTGSDGYRVLVDRLWPRGIKKEEAHVNLWLKEIAPTTVLRKWFNHDPEKWAAFQKKYAAELKDSAALQELSEVLKKHKKVSLLYGAKDEQHNHALVIMDLLKKT